MSADGSLRPRLHNGAHDVLRAVESVHPDVWSDEERQEELLHAAELLEAATLRLAAAHFATVAPGDDRPAALRRAADRLEEGRTIVGSVEGPSVQSDRAEAGREGP
ncbi:hypothetical protein ABZ569_33965 [Streptomyces albus]|uniref:hypothetical protein n=1 Tax=Streptomyces albus TaxID=1888 RepID=UPI0033D35A6F